MCSSGYFSLEHTDSDETQGLKGTVCPQRAMAETQRYDNHSSELKRSLSVAREEMVHTSYTNSSDSIILHKPETHEFEGNSGNELAFSNNDTSGDACECGSGPDIARSSRTVLPVDEQKTILGEDEVDMGMGRANGIWEVTSATSRTSRNSESSSKSSDSDDSDSHDSGRDAIEKVEDYRVENKILKEVRSNISQCPPLFTQESVEAKRGQFVVNQNTEIETVEDCDGNIFSSLSSVASNMAGYRIVKRKSAILKISGQTDFFKLQTVKYEHDKKTSRQHYMKKLPEEERDVEGDIGLKPGDLLLGVNKKSLKNKTQKKVLKIFRKIRPRADRKIYIELLFRRWEVRSVGAKDRLFEVDYQLHLELEPDLPDARPTTQRRFPFLSRRSKRDTERTYKVADRKQRETKREELPKGQIDEIVSKGQEKHRIEPLQYEEEFVTVDHDGLVCIAVWNDATASKNVFEFHYFRGFDKSQEPLSQLIYCCRMSCPGPVGARYLTSDIHAHPELIFHVMRSCIKSRTSSNFGQIGLLTTELAALERLKSSQTYNEPIQVGHATEYEALEWYLKGQISKTEAVTCPDDVDESCFILRALGREYLFESLLHRGFYIGYEKGDDDSVRFIMTEKTKHQVIQDSELDGVKFKLWPVKKETTGLWNRLANSNVMNSLLSCTGRSSKLKRKR